MTIEEIKAYGRPMLTPAQAAPAIGMNPNTLRWQAKQYPEKLGFHIINAKSRTYIPRLPFIEYVEGREPNSANDQLTTPSGLNGSTP